MKYTIYPAACILGIALSLACAPLLAETYTYDSSGRLSSVTYDDNSIIRYSYDAAGNMIKRAVSDGSIESTVIAVLEQIDDFLATAKLSKKEKKKMKSAQKSLNRAQGRFDDGNVAGGFAETGKAVRQFAGLRKKHPNAADWIDQLVQASKLKAQASIDAAQSAPVNDPDLIAAAVEKMADAQTQLDKNKPDKAIKHYQNAWSSAGKAVLPDIRGSYAGTYQYRAKKCKPKKDNGKLAFTLDLQITAVNGAQFSGTAVGSAMLDGVPVEDSFTIEGRIDADGNFSGETTRTYLATTGKGSFSGKLVGDSLTMSGKGKDVTGNRCKYTRKIEALR